MMTIKIAELLIQKIVNKIYKISKNKLFSFSKIEYNSNIIKIVLNKNNILTISIYERVVDKNLYVYCEFYIDNIRLLIRPFIFNRFSIHYLNHIANIIINDVYYLLMTYLHNDDIFVDNNCCKIVDFNVECFCYKSSFEGFLFDFLTNSYV